MNRQTHYTECLLCTSLWPKVIILRVHLLVYIKLYEVVPINIPILKMKKLRERKIKYCPKVTQPGDNEKEAFIETRP